MSLRDRPAKRIGLSLIIAVAALAAAGCTVRPLYMDGPPAAGATSGVADRLASIAISAPRTRQGQEVRNHLIFLFGKGGGEPASAAYDMNLLVTSRVISAAVIQVGTSAQEPTSSLVSMTATYTITNRATGAVVARGTRSSSSAYDLPRQQFAAYRARLDAENRAARELAEIVNLAVAQQLSSGG